MSTKPVQLLALATAVAALSLYFNILVTSRFLLAEAGLSYVPMLLGCLSMWLCLKARAKSTHKALFFTYAIVIAPFAFSYPAWIFYIWVIYAFGHYHGPMP
jgi:hypothetical protein